MTSQQFENLVDIGQLKPELGDPAEFNGLVGSGRVRLRDAHLDSLSLESRFDLAYNAAHALSLAALRWNGYRSDNRYIVFQFLPHTLGVDAKIWRVLAHCHSVRNRGEYEGLLDINQQLISDLIEAAEAVLAAIEKLGPIPL